MKRFIKDGSAEVDRKLLAFWRIHRKESNHEKWLKEDSLHRKKELLNMWQEAEGRGKIH